jgi:hypothetical protein
MAGLLQFDPNDPANALLAGPAMAGVQTLTPPQSPQMTPDQIASVKMAPTGLSGLLSGLKDATYTPDTNGMTFWDKLGAFGQTLSHTGGGDGGADPGMATIQAFKDRAAAAQKRQEMMAVADKLGMSDREKLTFLANQDEWGKQNATNYAFHDIAGGNTGVFGGNPATGGTAYTAPKLTDHDGVYGTQGANGYQQTGTAQPSYADETARMTARLAGVKTVDPTQNVVDLNPSVNPSGADNQPRGVRNNNPLNITGSGWNGQTGSDGQYAKFATPEAGFAAADTNLQAYASKHGINTVAGIVSRWAPPGDNNPTGAYTQYVAKKLGIDPNQPLNLSDPNVRRQVLSTMSEFELGRQSAPAAPRTLVQGQADPSARPMTAQEKAAYGISADTAAAMTKDGPKILEKAPKAALPHVDAARLDEINKAAAAGGDLIDAASQYRALSQGTQSGPAQMLNPGFLGDNTTALNNLTNNIAVASRAPGMRLTQMEVQMFKDAAPNIRATPEQNEANINNLIGMASIRKAKANFFNDWVEKNGSLSGADNAWQPQEDAMRKKLAGNVLKGKSAAQASSAPASQASSGVEHWVPGPHGVPVLSK